MSNQYAYVSMPDGVVVVSHTGSIGFGEDSGRKFVRLFSFFRPARPYLAPFNTDSPLRGLLCPLGRSPSINSVFKQFGQFRFSRAQTAPQGLNRAATCSSVLAGLLYGGMSVRRFRCAPPTVIHVMPLRGCCARFNRTNKNLNLTNI